MKKLLFGFVLALGVFAGVAAMWVQDRGILIRGGFEGEPKLKAVQPNQTANWIEFDNFVLPANGILPAAYGGTGTNSMAIYQKASAVLTNLANKNGGDLTNIVMTATNTLSSLTVQGAVGADGVVAAIRKSANQTNDIFQVQTEANAKLFGVNSNGLAECATFKPSSTNAIVLRSHDGSVWILKVGTDGALSTVTNSTGL